MNAVRSPYHRSMWYKAFRFDADKDNLFSQTDSIEHGKTRQKLSPGYSGKENPFLEPDMDKVILAMLDLIKQKYISKAELVKPVNIGRIIQYTTLDIITLLGSGKSLGWLEEDADKYEYIATMEQSLPAMTIIAATPALNRFVRIPVVQRAILPRVTDRVGMGKIKAVAREIIAERFKPGAERKTRKDMIQSFIDHGMTDTEIADETLFQIVAGSDTSSLVMAALMVYCLSNPQIYYRLKAEVSSVDVPEGQIISNAQVQKLPYLNACIKETLRYHPVNTGLLPKTVGPQGDTLHGYHLPPGTDVGICAWMIYRHNPVYGPDNAIYRPERWLEASPEKLARMEREHELVFWYGAYKCLGERIARIELGKLVFELFKNFDMTILDPVKPFERRENHGLWILDGPIVRVEESVKRGEVGR